MINRIRRNYLKLALPIIVVLLLAAAILLWITKLGILYAFKTPVKLSSLSVDNLKGNYASVNVDELADTFSYYGYTDDNNQSVVIERYCVYLVGDKFLTVRVTGDGLNYLKAYDDAKDAVASGELGSLKEVQVSTLTGTITPTLDSKVYDLLCSYIKENYLSNKDPNDAIKQSILQEFNITAGSDTSDDDKTDYTAYYKEAIIPLQLESGYYGIMPEKKVIILTLIALVLFLAALALIISLFIGLWEKPLRKSEKKYGRRSLVEDYKEGTDFKQYLRVGNNYVWWFKGLTTYIAEISGIIWTYPRSRRLEGGKLTWYLVLKTEDQQEFSVHLSDASTVQSAVDLIKSKGYPMVTGYDKEKQKLYDKDIPTFKARARNGTL